MVVEDDDGVRELVRADARGQRLRGADRRATPTRRRACAPSAARIDLLLTDVVMPEVNGRELAERLGALAPEMRILFMSGYSDEAVVRHGDARAEAAAFLEKPFTERDARAQGARGARPRRLRNGAQQLLTSRRRRALRSFSRNHGDQGRPRRAGRVRRGGGAHAARGALRARGSAPSTSSRSAGSRAEATPLLGGLAIFGGALVAGLLFLPDNQRTEGILAAAALITIVGALDDIFDLHPAIKLARPDRGGGRARHQRRAGRRVHVPVRAPRRARRHRRARSRCSRSCC